MRNLWFTRVVFAVGLATASWFLTAPQGQAAETSISSMSVETLNSILQEWGATDITQGADESMTITDQLKLTIKVATFKHNGLIYAARTYCHPEGGCVGVRVTCAFEDSGTALATLNSYNANFRAGKAFQTPKAVVSERYIILDHGVARENVVVQLAVYAAYTSYLIDYMKTATIAALPTGGAAPVSFKPPAGREVAIHAAAAGEAFKPQPVNRVR